ncbi:hypothetical protein [Veronia pacifica]|uniref:Uncharacterized protein n=1 Tax=Veronia pacifica TaxID=1080227 RepID=A0A1C3EIJ8_9GAMM|nr:hypothetical protein [Veronia pacifica]ODA33071.1 hypothetical protein A8L45_11540 [Veronia pacifica]
MDVVAKMIRVSIYVFLSVLTTVLTVQVIYTLGYGRHCGPHYADRRVYFHTHHSLSNQWSFDVLGIASRTMKDLVDNHPEVSKAAFLSSGNMHNPKVMEFGLVFRSTIAKHALPFIEVGDIEKLSIVKSNCK